MVKEVWLDDTRLKINGYDENNLNGVHQISVDFSEQYHDITTLLYRGTFNVAVPERDITFKGTIQQYSTSITNLYKKGQTADFHLRLIEMK
ncbi:DUF3219 family protein [Alteribacillus bidgolensis]|uniref:DUF3219 domain-containing protein n=1 Tax=Alteribacillus bidgolensis TaxID=930129 RepID=A0A1G8QK98_9BACI|nr:DUF3219 family protein [Alteribacillus bidgolensis]SDJ04815.1 Protein of unknown function [Alteribacillus bidgolensis]